MNAYKITDGLWLRGRTDRLHITDKAMWARSHGLTHVVSLCRTQDPDWALVPGVTYIPAEIPDGVLYPETAARLTVLADSISAGRVLVYCNYGRNRSPLLAALVLMRKLRISGTDALGCIRSVKPTTFYNPYFCAWLEALHA